MHQNSWRPWLHPGPHWGAHAALFQAPLAGGLQYRPSTVPKNPTPAHPFGLRARLAPAMLIAFRRYWRLQYDLSVEQQSKKV